MSRANPFTITANKLIDAIRAHDAFAESGESPLIKVNKNLVSLIEGTNKLRDTLTAADTPEMVIAQSVGSTVPWVPNGPLEVNQTYLVAVTTDKQTFGLANDIRWELMRAMCKVGHKISEWATGWSLNWSDQITDDGQIGKSYIFPSARGAMRCIGVTSINVRMNFHARNMR